MNSYSQNRNLSKVSYTKFRTSGEGVSLCFKVNYLPNDKCMPYGDSNVYIQNDGSVHLKISQSNRKIKLEIGKISELDDRYIKLNKDFIFQYKGKKSKQKDSYRVTYLIYNLVQKNDIIATYEILAESKYNGPTSIIPDSYPSSYDQPWNRAQKEWDF